MIPHDHRVTVHGTHSIECVYLCTYPEPSVYTEYTAASVYLCTRTASLYLKHFALLWTFGLRVDIEALCTSLCTKVDSLGKKLLCTVEIETKHPSPRAMPSESARHSDAKSSFSRSSCNTRCNTVRTIEYFSANSGHLSRIVNPVYTLADAA